MLSALELRGIRDVERGMQFLTNGRHFTFQRLAFLSNSVDCSRKFVKTRTGLEFAGLDIEGDVEVIIAGIQDWYLEVRLSSKA